jgi:hypothetical protein
MNLSQIYTIVFYRTKGTPKTLGRKHLRLNYYIYNKKENVILCLDEKHDCHSNDINSNKALQLFKHKKYACLIKNNIFSVLFFIC